MSTTIGYQKERIVMIKQIISDEEYSNKEFKKTGIARRINLMGNNVNLYEELEKEKLVLKIMEKEGNA